jgi:hypothetical protein
MKKAPMPSCASGGAAAFHIDLERDQRAEKTGRRVSGDRDRRVVARITDVADESPN